MQLLKHCNELMTGCIISLTQRFSASLSLKVFFMSVSLCLKVYFKSATGNALVLHLRQALHRVPRVDVEVARDLVHILLLGLVHSLHLQARKLRALTSAREPPRGIGRSPSNANIMLQQSTDWRLIVI